LMTWYKASSSSGAEVSKRLIRPSVLEDRRRVGCEGCRARVVTVSVCDSTRERVGALGWRASLGVVRWVQ
jgi:hypothetical protein